MTHVSLVSKILTEADVECAICPNLRACQETKQTQSVLNHNKDDSVVRLLDDVLSRIRASVAGTVSAPAALDAALLSEDEELQRTLPRGSIKSPEIWSFARADLGYIHYPLGS